MYQDQLPCGLFQIPTLANSNPSQNCNQNNQNCCQGDCQSSITSENKQISSKLTQNTPMSNRKKNIKLCYKCKQNPGSIIHKSEPMCRQCAIKNVEYKCRVNLQNKIKIKSTDRLLVCASGGMNSICLINILKDLESKFQKHLLFTDMEVIHIEMSCIAQKQQQYKKNIQKLIQFSKQKNFKLTVIPLSKIYNQKPFQIRNLAQRFNNGANYADLIEMFVNRLIHQYNQKQKKIIVKGTIGQKIATNIFKYLIKGKGQALHQLNWKSQNVIYPLREHLLKQMQYYYYHKKLDQYCFSQPSVNYTHKSNANYIDQILEDFMDSIQQTYSHTCPTILRTSQKIKPIKDKIHQCKWCLSNCAQQICLRCRRTSQNWISNEDINNYLPPCFINN